jgi:regulation of enolase protein 1 (concanavalin A-like superfamily)
MGEAFPGVVAWGSGSWTNPPLNSRETASGLEVTAVEGSDAWRTTSYGFVHDSEHALLAPFTRAEAVEVSFVADLTEQFDQAGVFVRASETHWVKAGVEMSDGTPQVGAVVTAPVSDWSVAPVPTWLGRLVTVRVSWSGDALTIRAGVDDEALRLVRVVPFSPPASEPVLAGPLVCAPTRAGLTVRFREWRRTQPDAALH